MVHSPILIFPIQRGCRKSNHGVQEVMVPSEVEPTAKSPKVCRWGEVVAEGSILRLLKFLIDLFYFWLCWIFVAL